MWNLSFKVCVRGTLPIHAESLFNLFALFACFEEKMNI